MQRLTPEIREKIAKLYRQGVPAPALAERFGVVTRPRQGRNKRCLSSGSGLLWLVQAKARPQPAYGMAPAAL